MDLTNVPLEAIVEELKRRDAVEWVDSAEEGSTIWSSDLGDNIWEGPCALLLIHVNVGPRQIIWLNEEV